MALRFQITINRMCCPTKSFLKCLYKQDTNMKIINKLVWTGDRRASEGVLICQSFLWDGISLRGPAYFFSLDMWQNKENCKKVLGSSFPKRTQILKTSRLQCLGGPCGKERQWPSRVHTELMDFSGAASSQGAVLTFPGRTGNKQVEHLCLRKEVKEETKWPQICFCQGDTNKAPLGTGLTQRTLGTHGLPSSRHRSQTQTRWICAL